jgi:hypothetical protein
MTWFLIGYGSIRLGLEINGWSSPPLPLINHSYKLLSSVCLLGLGTAGLLESKFRDVSSKLKALSMLILFLAFLCLIWTYFHRLPPA